ncbi:hypothetical protein ILUMI_06817 [Ignelater luminosus]|uniref:PiggyBac transposable element-derived protein domain-containing protein n=1 Tax=Ignelater luminosus TaxID=2038154 RepID=A0A8K0D983_IGNLU|nr:hypothetical protein ILUMI_06817 [Ignelater luminosus]
MECAVKEAMKRQKRSNAEEGMTGNNSHVRASRKQPALRLTSTLQPPVWTLWAQRKKPLTKEELLQELEIPLGSEDELELDDSEGDDVDDPMNQNLNVDPDNVNILSDAFPVLIKKIRILPDQELFGETVTFGFDILYKIRPIIEFLRNRFVTVPTEESLAIDEHICATKVRYHRKQYVQNKPQRRNIVFITIRQNQIPDRKHPSEANMEYTATIDSVEISNIAWKDNKIVNLISFFVGQKPQITGRRYERNQKPHLHVSCPQIVEVYNKQMSEIDLLDRHIGRHRIKPRSKKWYFRIFYHLINLAVINAWLLYKRVCLAKIAKPSNQKQFRIEVAPCLCIIGKKSIKRERPSTGMKEQLPSKNVLNDLTLALAGMEAYKRTVQISFMF